MEDSIQAAITKYLEEKIRYNRTGLPRLQFPINHDRDKIAHQITAVIAPHISLFPKFHDPSEYPTRVEGEDFSVDVFILDETGVHGIGFWNFDDKVWRFHTDTLVDYNEPNAETKWKWYYPPYDLNQVFNR